MSPEDEARIRKLRDACGCKSGMATMVVGIVGYLVACTTGHGPADLGHRLLIGVGVALTGAMAGKLAGLLWARVRLAALDAGRPSTG